MNVLYLFPRICVVTFFCSSICAACNEGWVKFQNACYKVSPKKEKYMYAENYCSVAIGELALVNTTEVIRFLQSMQGIDGKEEYWLQKGSFDPNTSGEESGAASLCPYMKVTEILKEFCSEEKYFICQYQDTNYGCDERTKYAFQSGCYEIVSGKRTYEEAGRYCKEIDAKLAILDNDFREVDIRGAIMDKNETFLLDAVRHADGIVWGNGLQFAPVAFAESSEEGEGDCIGIRAYEAYEWIRVNCSKSFAFICQLNAPGSTITLSSATSTTATTTEEPKVCPAGSNWHSDEESEFCFWETSYKTDRLNWFDAREFCKRFGGDLASYQNERQESIVLLSSLGLWSLSFPGVWIGMTRDENDVMHWVDDTPLNYSNFAFGEPNLQSKSKYCVAHYGRYSYWELDYCGVRRWFVCKAPKVSLRRRQEVIPASDSKTTTNCVFDSESEYHNRWQRDGNTCYLIRATGIYTWDSARVFCQNNGGYLTSVHSYEETNIILNMITASVYSNFWIGLHTNGIDMEYRWYDNTPTDFFYWPDRNDSKNYGLNTCVAFNKRDGSWETDHCNSLKGVICKREINASYDFPTPEPTSSSSGSCEKGWYMYGGKALINICVVCLCWLSYLG